MLPDCAVNAVSVNCFETIRQIFERRQRINIISLAHSPFTQPKALAVGLPQSASVGRYNRYRITAINRYNITK